MYQKPTNNMICYKCGEKIEPYQIGYYATYEKGMMLVCTPCINQMEPKQLSDLEKFFSEDQINLTNI